ncbi:unnamed protein product [Closterium sp. NIES-64]|nr:unnamed protein product [Closterium sp. NIES-64]
MDALDGHVLLRVADATGDLLPTIARLASLSRAFARVSRDELWPLYCLSRAARTDEGEAAAVVARLVREAGSTDAPRNAASSLARCVSACPGMAHACSAALGVDAPRPPPVPRVGGSATGADAARGEADGVEGSAAGGRCENGLRGGGVGGNEGVEEGTRAERERGAGGGAGEVMRSEAAGGGNRGTSASGSERGGERDAPTDTPHTNPSLPTASAASPPPVAPHLDDLCSLCSDLAPQLFRPECFLPAPSFLLSPPPGFTPPRTSLPPATTSTPSLPPCSSLGEEQAAEDEGGVRRDGRAEEVTLGEVGGGEVGEGEVGEGEVREGEMGEGEVGEGELGKREVGEGEIRESKAGEGEVGEREVGKGEVGEGAAVVMRTRGCGAHWRGMDHCCVVRGAIAGFRQSRFRWLLQGQPFAQGMCPFCHGQAWNATALLQPAAHTVLGCAEGDVCCFICTQGHLFGLYKSRRSAFDGMEDWDDLLDDMDDDDVDFDDMFDDYMDGNDMDDGVVEDEYGDYDAFEDAFDDYREMIAEEFENEPDWF